MRPAHKVRGMFGAQRRLPRPALLESAQAAQQVIEDGIARSLLREAEVAVLQIP